GARGSLLRPRGGDGKGARGRNRGFGQDFPRAFASLHAKADARDAAAGSFFERPVARRLRPLTQFAAFGCSPSSPRKRGAGKEGKVRTPPRRRKSHQG